MSRTALGVGGLRAVGEPGQVALERGDGLGELLLALEDLADLERRVHRQSGRGRVAVARLGPESLAFEEGPECVEASWALPRARYEAPTS